MRIENKIRITSKNPLFLRVRKLEFVKVCIFKADSADFELEKVMQELLRSSNTITIH